MSPKKPRPPQKRPPAQMALGSAAAIPIGRRSGDACARVDRVAEYLDGVLDPAAQDELLGHLDDCQICQAALHGEVQLRDREDELRAASVSASSGSSERPRLAAPDAASELPSLDRARQHRAARWKIPAALAAIAAVAAAGLFVFRGLPGSSSRGSGDGPGSTAPVQLALAAKRPFEARLSWGPAAAHRPYEPMRSSAAALGETISLEVRARLEKQKDCAGLAATALLAGDTATAERQYADPACASPDAQADRAALAVTLRNYDQALELCDAVLAEQPDHAVALWNRALALREKGLGLAAAAAFDRVAAVEKDAAWRAEATKLSGEARRPFEKMQAAWDEVRKTGAAMIPDGPLIPLHLASAVPGRARLRFYDAVRTAKTAARLDELLPLAKAIQRPGDHSLEALLADARRALSPARAALVEHYVEIFQAQSVEGDKEWLSWQAKARSAGALDLLFGAHFLALPFARETAQLALATKDPWAIGLNAFDRFGAFLSQNDIEGAGTAAKDLEEQCSRAGVRLLCMQAAQARAELSLAQTQAAPAVPAAREAFELATADGEIVVRANAVYFLGESERLRRSLGVARAYYEEYGEWAKASGNCREQLNAAAALAEMAFTNHQFTEVQRLLRALPSCETQPPRPLLNVQGDLLTAGIELDAAAWKKALLEILDDERTTESDRLLYEYLLFRQDISSPDTRLRLRKLIEQAAASKATTASRIKTAAESTLVVDAGRRGQWEEVLALAATAHRVSLPSRCALAYAKDNFQRTVAVVSDAGEVRGIYQADAGAGAKWALPVDLVAYLKKCDDIAVLAFPPWPGGEPPLPPSQPWHFVMGESKAPAKNVEHGELVIIANSQPPAALQLATLSPVQSVPPQALLLSGADASIDRVARSAPTASLLEFHVHTAKHESSDAPALALSESASGWALTAEQVGSWTLERHPIVLLADCSSAVPAKYDHVAWGLPAAFLRAGARAVVAPLVDIPDDEGGAFFAKIREELARDPDVVKTVARLRAEKIATHPTSWVRYVVVFQ